MTILLAATLAVQPAPACTPSYPPALAAWPVAHPAAHGFVVGRTVELAPVPVANVRLAVQPSRPLSGAYVASGTFAVTAAGTYIVAAGGTAAPVKPLWLDVAGADGVPLKSVAHAPGPACSAITKTVEFTLAPGSYTVLATGLATAAPIRVLVVRRP